MQVNDITGLILAGGRGSRMGGVDKGLQPFRGAPLVLHSLRRLQAQLGSDAHMLINANRNLGVYASYGAPVHPDGLADYAGPLAGFLVGLTHCPTPWLLTVPCDSPLFPADLVTRMVAALAGTTAKIAMAAGPETDRHGATVVRAQPVFCLLHVSLLPSLQAFTEQGGRKIDAWTAQHPSVWVPFDQPGDDPQAFFNANTLAQLQSLEQL